MADFTQMIAKERERISKLMDDARAKRTAIDEELAGYEHDLKRFDAFENFGAPKRKSGGGGKRGSRQDAILAVLKKNPDGINRGDLLTELGLKGDKTGEQSVSNALGNMKKANKIGSKDGKYTLA